MVHLEHGSAAWEVLAILAESGLAADRVVLAHIDRNPDPGLHAELSAAGAYLGYDGMARHSSHSDSVILDCLERAITSGGNQKRFVIGADVARRSRFRAYGGMPGLEYLPSRFIPRLVAQLGEDVARDVTTQNPASLLTMTDADG
jgi:phosphotriesterase-related protein